MDEMSPDREDPSGSGDDVLDEMLSDLLMLMSSIGDRLIVEDDDDPDALVGSNAVLQLYDDGERSPLPSHSLRIGPRITDSGNVALTAELTYMPTGLVVVEDDG